MSSHPESYSVAEAARRMGIKPARVYQSIKERKLTKVSGDPIRVRADEVDQARSDRLKLYSDVLDLSDLPMSEALTASQAQARDAAHLARIIAACDSMVDDGVTLVQKAKRILADELLATLPPDPERTLTPREQVRDFDARPSGGAKE